MDAVQTCETLLSYVKNSNLNFNLNESPFSVNINIRKSFIKDKNGSVRTSKLGGIFLPDPSTKGYLEDENQTLRVTIAQHEHENEALNVTIHELSMKLEKAKVELTETISDKNRIEIELAKNQNDLVDEMNKLMKILRMLNMKLTF